MKKNKKKIAVKQLVTEAERAESLKRLEEGFSEPIKELLAMVRQRVDAMAADYPRIGPATLQTNLLSLLPLALTDEKFAKREGLINMHEFLSLVCEVYSIRKGLSPKPETETIQ